MDRWTWLGFGACVTALAGYLVGSFVGQDRRVFLPGPTTHGHHQIEMSCNACHSPMKGVTSAVCLECHGAELAEADDSHPASKFRDPRHAELLRHIDVTACVTCHVEHREERTGSMGVTVPSDYCVRCHDDIAEERPNHAGYGFETCQNAGCHNFHDNRALNEDFLVQHLDEPGLLPERRRPRVPRPTVAAATEPVPDGRTEGLDAAELARVVGAWSGSTHATGGVNCSGCHDAAGRGTWVARPDHEACAGCHRTAVDGFLAGHHGMRLAAGLSPMRPAMSRLPMQADAHERDLTCTSCHDPHREVPHRAATDACLGCHADPHSLAYEGSKHAAAWRREVLGEAAPGTGVSCATCHLPVVRDDLARGTEHNQNANLRPNEKMVRSVCQSCHGLEFALQALADPELIRSNFQGLPTVTIEGLRLVREKRSTPREAPNHEE